MRKIEELGYGDFEEEPIESDEIDSDKIESESEEGGESEDDDDETDEGNEDGIDTRYMRVVPRSHIKDYNIRYSNAKRLAKAVKLEPLSRYNCLVPGNFIFGDFIEALFVEQGLETDRLIISTLSLKQDNVDSLKNLIQWGCAKNIDMIVSEYFYYMERWGLVSYMYDKLDDQKTGCFQLAVAYIHTKVVLFETVDGQKVVIHGSANIRSSGNIEQFTIEDNDDLFEFYEDYHRNILNKYSTINKKVKNPALRSIDLWNTIIGEKPADWEKMRSTKTMRERIIKGDKKK